MQFTFLEENDFIILGIKGEVRVSTILPLKKEFQTLMLEEKHLALDLEELKAIDSSGISLFVNIFKKLETQKRTFCIYNIPPPIQKIFKEINLSQFIRLYGTREDFIQENVKVIEDDPFPPADYNFNGKLFKPMTLKCELCSSENIKGFMLNKATQELYFPEDDIIPAWQGKKGNNDLDIFAMQITICPLCYFATRHLNYFTDLKGEFVSVLDEKERYALTREASTRKRMLSGANMDSMDKFFPPFSSSEAYWVYLLAEESAHSLFRLENRLATFDMAQYNMQISRFCGEREHLDYIRKAYMWYAEIHKNQSRFAPLTVIETYYYLCLASQKLKRVKDGERFLTEFRDLNTPFPEYRLYLTAAERLYADS
ncbi:MAG: hypothetical protein A2293_13465 [Elusimicrobia bacterium RIFOXYB2_FULL_49_7]|nr:MAG: hypothetical protein A2293_13465 [Elusimicrobia bacterium RIFOXYB2_FULL_49_7]